jgi:hypothetical protein
MTVILLLPVFIVIAYGLNLVLETRVKHVRLMRGAARMEMLARKIEIVASNKATVSRSAYKASSLYSCLNGKGCKSNYNKPRHYILDNIDGTPISGQYSIKGVRCKSSCPLQVETSYEARCSTPGKKSCAQPAEIITHYRISQRKKSAFGGRRLKTITGRVTISKFSCDASELMMGLDATGRPVCDKPLLSQAGSKCEDQAGFGINGEGRLDCRVVRNYCGGDIALSLTMDTSGSMNRDAGGGSRMAGAKSASGAFVDLMQGKDNFGLVEFNTNASVIGDLEKDKKKLKGKITELKPNGWTNMTAGLAQAAKQLEDHADPGALKVIVFLSDGQHNQGEGPEKMAEKLKKDGFHIWSIAFGKDANQALLRRIASSPSSYQFAKDNKQLKKLFGVIGKKLCRKY